MSLSQTLTNKLTVSPNKQITVSLRETVRPQVPLTQEVPEPQAGSVPPLNNNSDVSSHFFVGVAVQHRMNLLSEGCVFRSGPRNVS
jgi:hypothetical protein